MKSLPTRASHAGRTCVQHDASGFTLLELMVVILLLATLLGFAIPAVRGGRFMESHASAARKMTFVVKKLKLEALTRQVSCTLHLDLDTSRLWVTRGDDPADGEDDQPHDAWQLPEGIRIDRVLFPDQREIAAGEVEIGFYPQGFSDRAVIRLSDEDDVQTDILVEAFLPFARILAEDDGAAFGR